MLNLGEKNNKFLEESMKIFLLILVPFSLGYLITSVFRSINVTQGIYIQKDLNLSIFQISTVSSIYFPPFVWDKYHWGFLLIDMKQGLYSVFCL